MLIREIMTTKVVTVSRNTPVVDAMKIMKEHNFSRLPVVDNKGRLVGLVTKKRLEDIKPKSGTPLLWQIHYLIAHTTVSDVMRKRVTTVNPTDTVEQAVAKAQSAKVGTLIVLDNGKIVGICTTNDFFYRLLNPTLGIGEPGSRLVIDRVGNAKSVERVISLINRLGVETTVIWTLPPSTDNGNDIALQLDIQDPSNVIRELEALGFTVHERKP